VCTVLCCNEGSHWHTDRGARQTRCCHHHSQCYCIHCRLYTRSTATRSLVVVPSLSLLYASIRTIREIRCKHCQCSVWGVDTMCSTDNDALETLQQYLGHCLRTHSTSF